eukprot:1194574-Prorocentrum_minimum.AAC.8
MASSRNSVSAAPPRAVVRKYSRRACSRPSGVVNLANGMGAGSSAVPEVFTSPVKFHLEETPPTGGFTKNTCEEGEKVG